MQRLAFLALALCAACTSYASTGEASLTGVTPAVKASAAEEFTGPDAGGTKVMGWTILLYQNDAGGDSKEGTVLSKLTIYTNTAAGSQPEALLTNNSSISIITDTPPTITSNPLANMGVNGVSNVTGQVTIVDFRLSADAKHADYIKGSINAGGYGDAQQAVALAGDFDAPVCKEQ
jgi:hypothetical protein